MRKFFQFLTCISFFASTIWAAEKPFVKPNDMIVFMGDSITVASAKPTGFANLVVEKLNNVMPEASVRFETAAKGGRGIFYLKSAFESQVAVHEPAIAVILIGINDVRGAENDKGADPVEYEAELKALVGRCQKIGAKVIICSPIFRGEKTDGTNPYDPLIAQYVAACETVAAETSSAFVDLRAIFMEKLRVINPENAEAGHLSKDGVHPNAEGNVLIAESILKVLLEP